MTKCITRVLLKPMAFITSTLVQLLIPFCDPGHKDTFLDKKFCNTSAGIVTLLGDLNQHAVPVSNQKLKTVINF